MLRIIFNVIIPAALILVSLALFAAEAVAEPPASPTKGTTCPVKAEDEPGWDWTRCGNHKRGVLMVKLSGDVVHRVVGVCRFQRLAHRGALDSETPRLRGDRRALRAECD